LNNVAANYSFNASNSSRGVIRMHQKNGVGSVMEFIAQGTSAGNFPGHMEFFTQTSGYNAPVKNMTLYRDGTLTLHNGNLVVGSVTYPKVHNSTNGQVLTINNTGIASWQTLNAADNLGNHTASQNLKLNGKFISNDGGNEGFSVDNNGYTYATHSLTIPASGTSSYTYNSNYGNSTILRSYPQGGTPGSVTQLIAQGQSSGNWSSTMEFYTQYGGGNSPVVNMKIDPQGNIFMPNGTLKVGNVTYPKTHNSTNGQVLTINNSGIASWQTLSGADNMGNATTSNQLTLNNVAANYSFNASNSSRGVIRMHQKNGVGSVMEFIAQGTSAGNFPGHMEFFTQTSGYNAPVKNMTLYRDGTLTLHNGNLVVGSVTYPKVHNSTNGQVLTVNGSGTASWQTISGDNMGNATTSNQLTLNNVAANYSFTASNSSRGVIRMHQKNGVGSVMEFIAQGTSSGNFPGHMEFFTQTSGYNAPVKNMTLYRNGQLTLHNNSVIATGFTTSSDRRLKTNIKPLENAITKLMKLNPVAYDKRVNLETEDYKFHEIGLIAQEVQLIYPHMVEEIVSSDSKLLGVKYQEIIPVLVKATQEQQQVIDSQKQQIENQNQVIQDLIKRIEALESK
ncbi:MAG: tail fiber domain-containing protein, partial [Bacteroidia bacterium]